MMQMQQQCRTVAKMLGAVDLLMWSRMTWKAIASGAVTEIEANEGESRIHRGFCLLY